MRYYVVLILTCAAAAQDFAIGVKGGVRATGDFEGSSVSSESKRYVVGPSVEIGLPARFSVEVDVLYRRFGYTSRFGSPFGSSVERGHADAWEFPMLLKYRLPIAGVRPFVAAGYAPRRFSLSADSSGYFINVSPGARIPFSNSTH